jgi:hypothetical protein
MAVLSDSQINNYLDKLLEIVEELPFNEKGKAYIKQKIIVDFFDTWQFDDESNSYTIDEYLNNYNNPKYINVKTTYGIKNSTQINRYMNEFFLVLKKTRAKALDKHLKELDNLHPAQKAARLSKSLAVISRAELFEKHNLDNIKEPEWNNQLKEILGNEITFAKEQADLLTKSQTNFVPPINDEEIFIVEELENRLAIEAVEYKRKIDDLWVKYKFDPNYFDNFIATDLLNEFTKSVHNRIRPLNNNEINRYLNLSLQQFKTHTPPKRHKAFLLNYHNTYWFPNVMEYKNNEYMDKYATHVWKHYTNYFSLFEETLQKIYNAFLLLNSGSASLKTNTSTTNTVDFDNFISSDKQAYLLKLLEDLSITNNGKSILSTRKKGALRGVVESLIKNNFIPQIAIDKAIRIIANKIDLQINSKLDYSDISKHLEKQTNQYLKNNPIQL